MPDGALRVAAPGREDNIGFDIERQTRSGRVGFTRMWMRLVVPVPLSVSPMIQRTRLGLGLAAGADEGTMQGDRGHRTRPDEQGIRRTGRALIAVAAALGDQPQIVLARRRGTKCLDFARTYRN
jgi:hypothetical protein